MASIQEIRNAIDAGLDKLQAKAEAAAVQLNLSRAEADTRIGEYEEKLKSAAELLQAKLADAKELTTESKTKIQSALEHLQVQLALGAADSRDAFNNKKKQILRAIAEFNAKLDAAEAADKRQLAADFDELIAAYASQAVALEAELEAMDEHYDKIA